MIIKQMDFVFPYQTKFAPPSLRNIFTELKDDLGIVKTSNELESWAKQGVLLLNASPILGKSPRSQFSQRFRLGEIH